MRKHFYDLKKQCPKTQSGIDLTAEVKEYVLKNRTYKTYKPPVLLTISNPTGKQGKKPDVMPGFLYIARLREFVNLDVPVYKVGRTYDMKKRSGQYPKGSEIVSFVTTDKDIISLEKDWIAKCKCHLTHRSDLGREYFEGDVEIIKTLCKYICDGSSNADYESAFSKSKTVPNTRTTQNYDTGGTKLCRRAVLDGQPVDGALDDFRVHDVDV